MSRGSQPSHLGSHLVARRFRNLRDQNASVGEKEVNPSRSSCRPNRQISELRFTLPDPRIRGCVKGNPKSEIDRFGLSVRVGGASQFENNYFTEMCSGSEAGSYLRRIDFVYHSTLGLIVLKKKKYPTSKLVLEASIHASNTIQSLRVGGPPLDSWK